VQNNRVPEKPYLVRGNLHDRRLEENARRLSVISMKPASTATCGYLSRLVLWSDGADGLVETVSALIMHSGIYAIRFCEAHRHCRCDTCQE